MVVSAGLQTQTVTTYGSKGLETKRAMIELRADAERSPAVGAIREAMTEATIERCRRNLAEGADRIARQEAIIASFTQSGHTDLLASALLAALQDTQRLGEQHLKRELAKLGTRELSEDLGWRSGLD